jgi:3-dehydroquinate synthase
MKIIKLNLKKRSYYIVVGSRISGILGAHLKRLNIGRDAYIVTNTAIKSRYARVLGRMLKSSGFEIRFKLIPDTEKSKSIRIASSLIEDLASYDKKRKVFIIALGGGVVGDVAGFVASIYKRGIPYIQIPTTLLAQVDSAIGGKTAVDLAQGKNLVGAFYQPRLVFSDVTFLKTLSLKQIQAGLAEVIKYGIIKDPKLFSYLERNLGDILALKIAPLEFIVKRCSYLKAKIVEQDEREEKGIRTILNFGHTIGHAIESAGDYNRYNHGQAIALGMLVACEMSKRLNFINDKILSRIEKLIEAIGLPTNIKKVSGAKILKAHYRDKKFIGKKNRFVLIHDIGKAKIVEDIPLALIREAIRKRI